MLRLFCVKYVTPILDLFKHKLKEPSYKRDVGARGEWLAVKFLKKRGYKILQRNYRCKLGEIDVVCYDHGYIAFVEVKTRYSDAYGPPELSVTEAKKRQIARVALHYIAEKKIEDVDFRFDVVSLFHTPTKKYPEITLFRNAFGKNDSTSSRM